MLALLVIPASPSASPVVLVAAGAVLVLLAEALRLWAVRHIGGISRTRSDRLGPLVATGPFAMVRNPLYVANILLWAGFAVSARLLLLVPVFLIVLALEYHAIVRWEEQLLESRRGDEYRDYVARVPRWIPVSQSTVDSRLSTVDRPLTFSWGETLFSERGTLTAIAAGYSLLWLKG